MKRGPIGDLQLLFLRLIAEETPDATAVLFSLRDAGEWMEHYGVSADWLELFLRDVLEQGQEHVDWVVEHRGGYDTAQIICDNDWRDYFLPSVPKLPDLPDELLELPRYEASDFPSQTEQPVLVGIWCEKTTQNDLLLPICRQYCVNLVTGAGELSDGRKNRSEDSSAGSIRSKR